MLSAKEVRRIAELARLGLEENEIKKFQKDLSQILDYFEKIKKIDVSKTEPMSHSIKIENVTRKDERPAKKNRAAADALLELAPKTEKRRVKVRAVL